MHSFVKFFLQEKHLRVKAGTPKKKPMSDAISQVFQKLSRCDLDAIIIKPYINIRFMAEFLNDKFLLDDGHCATKVIQHIFETLSVEHIPMNIIDRICSFERKN